MKTVRKVSGMILAGMVIIIAILSLLVIWEVIEMDVEKVLKRSFYSLFVLIISGAILLFIFSILFKTEDTKRPPKQPPIG